MHDRPRAQYRYLSIGTDGQPGAVAIKGANRHVPGFSRDLQYETVGEIDRRALAIVTKHCCRDVRVLKA